MTTMNFFIDWNPRRGIEDISNTYRDGQQILIVTANAFQRRINARMGHSSDSKTLVNVLSNLDAQMRAVNDSVYYD